MSADKINKLLAKAFNNSSKAEATAAFSMAFSLANREGLSLDSFRGKGSERVVYRDKIVYQGCSPEREKELVSKYNDLLAVAKDQRDVNKNLVASNNELIESNKGYQERNEKLLGHCETLLELLDSQKVEIAALKEMVEYLAGSKAA